MAQLSEQQLEQQMQTRELTQVQASWTEQERGGPGTFTIQLILDNGVAEYIVLPTANDAKVLLNLLQRSEHATFDMARKVLMFNNLSVD
jgi:hypothetical protein